jgi:hypothetical protein
MINENRQFIDNVFVVMDKNLKDKDHFLNISSEKWTLLGNFSSGGMEIGLYAWN